MNLKYLLPVLVLFLIPSVSAQEYQQPINLSVPTDPTPTDYQVQLLLNSSLVGGNFNWTNECVPAVNDSFTSRIRMLDDNQAAELDYWVQNCSVSSEEMTVWVEVDQVIPTGGYTIYMRYNNLSQTTASDIDDTFLFGDEFTSGALNFSGKWSSTDENFFSVADGLLIIPSLQASPDDAIYSNDAFTNFSAHALVIPNDTAGDGIFSLEDVINDHTCQDCLDYAYVNNIFRARWSAVNNDTSEFADRMICEQQLFTNSTGFQICRSLDGTVRHLNLGTASATLMHMGFLNGRTPLFYVDWAFIRTLSPEEPTASYGAEELVPMEIIITSPENTTYTLLPIDINVTTGENSSTCLWNIDDGTNTTMSNSSTTNWFSEITEDITDDLHQFNVYCQEVGGNFSLNNSIFFTFEQGSVSLIVNVFDEKTLDPILLSDLTFTIAGLSTIVSSNKTFISESEGADFTIDNPERGIDGDFDTKADFNSSYSAGGNYTGSINGVIDISTSQTLCLDYEVGALAGQSLGGTRRVHVIIALDDDGGTQRIVTTQQFTANFLRRLECFDLPEAYTFDGNSDVVIVSTFQVTSSGAPTPYMTLYEVANQFNNGTGQYDINESLLDLGQNRIKAVQSNGLSVERFYDLLLTGLTNQSLNIYLASITENIVTDTFIIQDVTGSPVGDASVSILKNIGGSFVSISDDTTDDSGTVSFQLIFQDQYRILIVSGTTTQISSFTALGTTRFITLNETLESNFTAPLDGITMRVLPQNIEYNQSVTTFDVNFSLTIASVAGDIDMFGITLFCEDVLINSTNITGSPSGGVVFEVEDVFPCDNNTLQYYFTKSGFDQYFNEVFYEPSIGREFGLWEAFKLGKGNLDQTMLNFIAIMVIVIVAALLAQFSAEGAAIGELIIGATFTAGGWLDDNLFILLTLIVFSVLLIKRRLL